MSATPAIRGKKRPHTRLRWLWGGLSVLACVALLLVAGVAVLLFTSWGRAHVARTIERQLNSEIMGTLRIAGIDRIDLPVVEAHGVQILAPDGVPAIDVHQVRLELDFEALREGRFAWHRAEIDGGTVRVSEDEQHRVNMEETFRARRPSPEASSSEKKESSSENSEKSPLDLRKMVTSNMTLLIYGGSLPKLHMQNLYGIMRVQELPNGRVSLRFDDYRGHFVKGLPTGRLDFEQVKGHVETDQKRLLRFEGRGLSEGEPVAFELDIQRKPTRVKIDARFPRLSRESLATLAFSAYTRFTKNLELNVQPGELRAERP